MRTKLHDAGEAGGEQTVVFEGDFALPREFMEYLKEHPQITLVYNVKYNGEAFTVTIPGSKVVVEANTDWYGPLGLRGRYGTGAANAATAKNSGTVIAPQTGETADGSGFWLTLIFAGAFGVTGMIMAAKRKNKFLVSDK